MNTIRLFLFVFFLELCCTGLHAQIETKETSSYHASLETQGVLTTKNYVPFWLRSNQFGSVPLPGTSGSFIGALRKDYDTVDNMPTDVVSGSHTKVVDWGASLELRGDMGFGQRSRLALIEGYAKLKVSIFELKAGRAKEIMGLVDTSLSSGAFAVSGNALGIPKVQISIPEYWTLPFFGDLFSVKGNFAHGWLGEQPIRTSPLVKQANTYFHQSSLYVRLGKPDWRLHLYGGFNHQVYWGHEKEINGKSYQLSTFKSFEYVVLGKTYQGSKVGNHLGSVDLGMEYEFGNTKLFLYRQNFYDEGALAKLANIADGLNGISLLNERPRESSFQWHRLLLELFYSKDQAGYPWSIRTKSGDENYYNNYQYSHGWSYKDQALGNPLITTYPMARAGLPNDPSDYFSNNRVVAFHAGMEGYLDDYQFTAKATYSFNYGTFGTSKWGYSTGNSFHPPDYGIWKEVRQFSTYLEVQRGFNNGWQAGCVAALDAGDLLYNSSGLILKLKKSF
ncbi:MAG TPA: capsule assembly Wzi family protein [Puia sp.]